MKVVYGLVTVALVVLSATGGCVSKAEFDKCARRNIILQEEMDNLERAVENERIRAEKCEGELDALRQGGGLCAKKVSELEAMLAEKNAMIDKLTKMVSESPLPLELSNALAEWARQVGSDLVEYDEKTGVVRFKSDLLFEKGQATVQAGVRPQLEQFARIMDSPAAEGFDVLIVGHTDDVPILKPETRAQHPTNWHLSAHRAIAVEDILAGGGMAETRLAVMGMGEFRPIAPNAGGNRGNALNRRVEIYIVPAGQIRIATGTPATGG